MKRTLLKLGLLLLAGAIINIAVAWGCALVLQRVWAPDTLDGWLPRRPNSAPWQVTLSSGIGAKYVDATDMSAYAQELDMEVFEKIKKGEILDKGRFLTVDEIPAWSCIHRKWELIDQLTSVAFWERAYGWPKISMSCCSEWRDNAPPRMVDAILFRGSMLPTRAYWPAFAINTIFYAVIVSLLFFAPFILRRWRRIRRGLCPACAYPVGTSDKCTECGKPVTPRRGAGM